MTQTAFISQNWMQDETLEAWRKVPEKTVAAKSHRIGMVEGEPLIIAMDSLIRYAKAYMKRYGRPLSEDGVLGDPWLDAAKGLRALLNGDGAVAMERGITTDSKDNGAVEAMFWAAMEIAGFSETDL